MAVPSTITDLNVSAASNSPAGSDTVATNTGPDEYIRALAAIIKREQSQFTATASATTVDLGAIATGSYGHITGTTTITGFGTVAAGIERTVVFDGALTLTHNATSLILPGGANITTAAGDIATFRSEGSGNWRCVSYVKASGAPVGSYQPLDATLTALAGVLTAAGKIPYATALDTAGELDFKDEDNMASDSATAVPSQQSTKAYVDAQIAANTYVPKYSFSYTGTGGIATKGASTAITTGWAQDNTIPQNTEGEALIDTTITCAVGDVIEVHGEMYFSVSTGSTQSMALFVDAVADALVVSSKTTASAGNSAELQTTTYFTATATSHTFKMRGATNAGTTTVNTGNSTANFGGVCASVLSAKVVGT